ncbi:MerR family transcriptional regulator [Kocuria sp. KH4]
MTDRTKVLVDTIAAAHAIDVPPARIRQWAHRGKIESAGQDERGRSLYALSDVRRVHREQKTKAAKKST